MGVRPDFRRMGLGRRLYERYFAAARMHGRAWVCSITSPGDRVSIAFHQSMGFVLESGDGIVDGVPVRLDYAGTGDHRVVFQRRIAPDVWPAAQEPHLVSPAAGQALLEVLELTDCA